MPVEGTEVREEGEEERGELQTRSWLRRASFSWRAVASCACNQRAHRRGAHIGQAELRGAKSGRNGPPSALPARRLFGEGKTPRQEDDAPHRLLSRLPPAPPLPVPTRLPPLPPPPFLEPFPSCGRPAAPSRRLLRCWTAAGPPGQRASQRRQAGRLQKQGREGYREGARAVLVSEGELGGADTRTM